jgi:hypothetical protein
MPLEGTLVLFGGKRNMKTALKEMAVNHSVDFARNVFFVQLAVTVIAGMNFVIENTHSSS